MNKKGNIKNLKKGGTIGNKGGSGRPPDWLKEHCRGIVDKLKLIERLGKIGSGANVDSTTTIDGRIVPIPAPMTAQVKAIQELLDRGFGRPDQSIGLTDGEGRALGVAVLPLCDMGDPGKIEAAINKK